MKRICYDKLSVTEALLKKAEQYGKETKGSLLSDIVVLHINHCMENSFAFSALLDRYFCRCIFVGAPYNDTIPKEDEEFLHCTGKRFSGDRYMLYEGDDCFYEGRGDFLKMTQLLIKRAMYELILPFLKEGKRVLIIEDGGYHYPVLAEFLSRYPEYEGQISGAVEQTASGTLRMRRSGEEDCLIESLSLVKKLSFNDVRDPEEAHGFLYPCCSISRSELKMRIESRFIGHRVTEELAYFLYTANAFLDFHEILILGYGIVGRQVALDLKSRYCHVSVLDTDSRMEAAAVNDGFSLLSKKPNESDIWDKDLIVIGCTGEDAFSDELLSAFLHGKAKRIYLSSASSQDIEFARFLCMARGERALPCGAAIKKTEQFAYYTRYEISIGDIEKEVYLIAEGLPVNFYRTDGISLTHSVMDLIFADLISAGLTLSFKQDTKKEFYLLGQGVFKPFLPEEEIAKLWYSSYGLSPMCGEILPAGHTEIEYLREKMLSEDSWRKDL